MQWPFLDGYTDIIEMCFSVQIKVEVQEVSIKYKLQLEINDDDDFGTMEHGIDQHDELHQMVGFMLFWLVEVIELNFMLIENWYIQTVSQIFHGEHKHGESILINQIIHKWTQIECFQILSLKRLFGV